MTQRSVFEIIDVNTIKENFKLRNESPMFASKDEYILKLKNEITSWWVPKVTRDWVVGTFTTFTFFMHERVSLRSTRMEMFRCNVPTVIFESFTLLNVEEAVGSRQEALTLRCETLDSLVRKSRKSNIRRRNVLRSNGIISPRNVCLWRKVSEEKHVSIGNINSYFDEILPRSRSRTSGW